MIRHSSPDHSGESARTDWPEQPRTRRVAPSPATNYLPADTPVQIRQRENNELPDRAYMVTWL